MCRIDDWNLKAFPHHFPHCSNRQEEDAENFLNFRRAAIRGAQPSARFASQRVLRGLCGGLFEGSVGSPRALRGVRGIFRG